MDFPTNPSPSQSLAMRRIGNEYANRAFAFGEPDPNMTRMRARPLSAPMTPMQAQFAAGPSSIGVAPRPLSAPMTPMQASWAGAPVPAAPMQGGMHQSFTDRPAPQPTSRALVPQAPYSPNWRFAPYQGALTVPPTALAEVPTWGAQSAPARGPTPQLGYTPNTLPPPAQALRLPPPAIPPSMMARAGSALLAAGRMAMGPVGLAAQGLTSVGMEGWERGAPQAGQDAYTYDQMGGITGLAPDAPPTALPSPQSTPLFDDHGHMTPAHPMAKQAMERPKVVAKQRQAAMERMMPYKDTRGAGMTMTSNVNGIREYEAPIDMSSIGVSAADPMDEGAYL